jgi:hypothetical protein
MVTSVEAGETWINLGKYHAGLGERRNHIWLIEGETPDIGQCVHRAQPATFAGSVGCLPRRRYAWGGAVAALLSVMG